MKKITALLLGFLIIFITAPFHVLAVDFTMDETNIDAYLEADGTVFVTESHTYNFDGDFNGITRTLIPKEGTAITDFQAEENGKSLETEFDDGTYKVYRSGEDEVITVELTYTITDAVEIYEDMAQFYWPFFDSGNENDYEDMTITIHPPQPTNDAIAIGYDEAYKTETIQQDGTVVFELGFVPSDKNGDIRVAYDNALFPGAAITFNEPIREELLKEQEELAEKEAAYLVRKDRLETIAPFATALFGLLLFFLIFYLWRKSKAEKLDGERTYRSSSFVPQEVMSMPATVYYFKNYMVGHGELLTVAMMDLVRKGNIRQVDEDTFQLKSLKTAEAHETFLLELLFKKIGKGDLFRFEHLEEYTKSDKNNEQLQIDLHEYVLLIKKEVTKHQLIDKNKNIRWIGGISGLLMIPLIILFGVHDLFIWMLVDIFIFGGLVILTFIAQTKTAKGHFIADEWKRFKEDYERLEWNNWYLLPSDEKERAVIFSTGLKDKHLEKKNKSFMDKLQTTNDSSDFSSIYLILLLSATASSSFNSATETSAASSTSFSGGGAGVGGGGGGSGAF